MKQFPCKDCITLGICKSRFNKNRPSIESLPEIRINLIVITNCCILRDYLYKYDSEYGAHMLSSFNIKTKEILDFFLTGYENE